MNLRAPLNRRVGPIPVYALILVVVVAVGYVATRGPGSPKTVVTAVAGPKTITRPLGGLGQSSAGNDFPVSLPFAAHVLSMDVQPGEPVTKGQQLFGIDLGNLQTALATLLIRQQFDNASLSQLNVALVNLQANSTTTTTTTKSTVPTPPPPAANNTAASNAAAISALQARIAAATARVGLDQQLIDIAHGRATPTVSAPVAGTVGVISINANQFAGTNRPVLDILDLSTIKVTANFPIADAAAVQPGAPATLEFGDIGNVTLNGSILSVSAQANSGGQDFQVIAHASNNSGQLIRAGLSAFISVPIAAHVPVAVSKLAVLDTTDVPVVFIVDHGMAHLRKVVLGVTDGQYYEIKSGLSAGEQCVVVGNNALSEGAKVRVSETQR